MRYVAVLLIALMATIALPPLPATAQGATQINGGGRGTLDGVSAFSQFGFGVKVAANGSASGRFLCLMAGASRVPGLHMMSVAGRVTSASVSGATATFAGIATVHMGDQGRVRNQRFRVTVTEGGPGVGTLRLELLGPDVSMTLPVEQVLNGQIRIH